MSSEPTTEVVVRRSVSVPIDPAKAFELFTERMTEFWPSEHSIGTTDLAEVVIEPREGGRWFERGVDGSECPWGRVAQWTTPGRLVLMWQITAAWQYDPSFLTEVEVDFIDEGAGRTRVELAHRHLERYGEHADMMRQAFDSPGGWTGTLNGFAALAG